MTSGMLHFKHIDLSTFKYKTVEIMFNIKLHVEY